MQQRAGAALIEFALVFPIIMLFVGAMLEFSRVSMLKHTADTAAYEAARAGIVVGANPQTARAAADLLLKSTQLKKWKVTVFPTTIDEDTAYIRVQVDIPIAENSWVSPCFFKEQAVSGSVTLIAERPAAVQLSGLAELRGGALGVNVLGLGL